jgi:hypothetical protein
MNPFYYGAMRVKDKLYPHNYPPAAADVALRRDVAFDLTLPFLGAALLGFREFSMERVDMVLGSVGRVWRSTYQILKLVARIVHADNWPLFYVHGRPSTSIFRYQ